MADSKAGAAYIDADSLFAAVKRLGITAPVFLDGERVSVPEASLMRLAALIEADQEVAAAYAEFAPHGSERAAIDRSVARLNVAHERQREALAALSEPQA